MKYSREMWVRKGEFEIICQIVSTYRRYIRIADSHLGDVVVKPLRALFAKSISIVSVEIACEMCENLF